MKYCSYCGKQIMEQDAVCPHCGCDQGGKAYVEDRPSIGLNILGFLVPVVGFGLYLIFEKKTPNKAKGIVKWSIYSYAIFTIIPSFLSMLLLVFNIFMPNTMSAIMSSLLG